MPPPARNAGKPWSPSEEEELLRNVQQYRGDIRSIAEVHGRSSIAINMRIASVIRRMVNAEGMDRTTVANLFFKSSQEMEEVLSPNTRSSTAKRASVSTTLQDMEGSIMTKLESIEKLLRKVCKKVGVTTKDPSSSLSTTSKLKTKKKKKKKKSYDDDGDDDDNLGVYGRW